MPEYFDSRSTEYKSPFGAVKAGTAVHLRVCLPRELGCERVRLSVSPDGGERTLSDLFWCGLGEPGYEWWECHFTPPSPGLYWYSFVLSLGGCDRALGLCRAGRGALDCSGAWQLTAFDPEFTLPGWLPGGIMYQIFPDRFARAGGKKTGDLAGRTLREDWGGQPDWRPNAQGKITNSDFFGGDLAGIREKLPFLSGLGVTVLYLNPIFLSHSNHRYDTADYGRVDPLLGDEQALKGLCEEAEKHGIRVILDGVFSHTGSDSVYFNREGRYPGNGAYNSVSSPYFDWYHFDAWPEKYRCWWGFLTLPEVEEESAGFLSFICGENGVARRWLRCGVSGWRLDVADELPDGFLEEFRRAVRKENPQALVLGEVWEDASNKISYGARRKFLLGRQLDSVMNYPFRQGILDFLLGKNAGALGETVLSVCENYPAPVVHRLMNHIGTHDTERILTLLGGEESMGRGREWQAAQKMSPEERQRGLRLLRLAAMIQFTLPGVPCIYYGDEAGMEGYRDPFNRGCYPWGNEDGELLGFYRALGALRRQTGCLREGGFSLIRAENGQFAFCRSDDSGGLLTAVNRSGEPMTLSAEGYSLRLSAGEVTFREGKAVLGPDAGAIFTKNAPDEAGRMNG